MTQVRFRFCCTLTDLADTLHAWVYAAAPGQQVAVAKTCSRVQRQSHYWQHPAPHHLLQLGASRDMYTRAVCVSKFFLPPAPAYSAATLSQMRPPMMAIMGHLLLGEAMGWFGAAGCFISLTGAIIVSHPPFLFGGHSDWGKHRLLGTVCGIASPLFGAGAGYCIRRIQKQEPALVVALWFHIVTVSILVWPLIAGWPEPAAMVSARDAGLLLGLSACSFCAQLLMTRAFQLLPAARASALSFMGVIYAHAWVSGMHCWTQLGYTIACLPALGNSLQSIGKCL